MQAQARYHASRKFDSYLHDLDVDTTQPGWKARASEITGYSTSHLGNLHSGNKLISPGMEEKLQALINHFKKPDVIPEPPKHITRITKVPEGVSGKPKKLKEPHKVSMRPKALSDQPYIDDTAKPPEAMTEPRHQPPKSKTPSHLTVPNDPLNIEALAVVTRALGICQRIRDETATGAQFYLMGPDGVLMPYSFDLDGEGGSSKLTLGETN